ncbi:MAG: hypothetical protein P4L99_08315 [Chthoniobacter sp.]|nr:hypothetical protein [Chthoniobacter sp.]
MSLTSNGKGVLKGEAVNTTAEAIEYMYPAGTLFSNGKGDVVLLHDTFVNLAPKKAAELSLSVAQTSSANGILSGEFSQRGEAEGPLHQLVHRISIKDSVAPSVAQTAVLILVDDAPLDTITSFPRLRPKALANTGPKPFCTAPQDLIAALALIRNAGIDLNKIAVMGEPQLEVMTMLNPDSHEAAMALFGITRETEWAYWQQELLQGDPSVRHYALYGIARYFPDVALEMLPSWVKTKTLPRSYRISAAWALALIEDSRANEELQGLRREFPDDAGLRQALDGALRHREGGNEKATGGTESKLNS